MSTVKESEEYQEAIKIIQDSVAALEAKGFENNLSFKEFEILNKSKSFLMKRCLIKK